MTKKSKAFYPLIILAFVTLFNPNINVVDILPDFIGWYILAYLFEYASDVAPYFEEARSGFIKLGFINILKIPAFFLVNYIRRQNALDNDVLALASFTFAVCELIFLIPCVTNLFRALFHVAQRTFNTEKNEGEKKITPDTRVILEPFSLPIIKIKITPDVLRIICYVFFVAKAVLSFLPDLFLLTRTTDDGQILSISKYYPYVLVYGLLLGLIIGAVWLTLVIKYTKRIHKEGDLFGALKLLATERSEASFNKKRETRKLNLALTLFIVASAFTLDFAFDNFKGINLLPQFLYALLLIVAILSLNSVHKVKPITIALSGVYLLFTTVSYVFSARFLTRYEYLDLMTDKSAVAYYNPVLIFSAIELISLITLLVFITLEMIGFIKAKTGVSPESERYRITEKRYHTSLSIRAIMLSVFALIMGVSKFIGVFLNSDIQILYAFVDDFDKRPIVASTLPWFGIVVLVSAVIYIGYSYYFFTLLKEEVKLKNTNII